MSAKVIAAINAVAAEVTRLGKSEKNQHGRYSYASIDDFLSMTGPLCAKHGLVVMQDERECEVRGEWLLMRFEFTLAHASGEVWATRPVRSILVSAKMGPQAFGAAQSYCLKQFLRSLFQIATGENDDIDAHKATPLPKKLDPRDGMDDVEPAEIDAWVGKFRDILDSDEDEYGHAAKIRGLHEQLKTQHALYTAIADRLAADKILTKAQIKAYLKLEKPRD